MKEVVPALSGATSFAFALADSGTSGMRFALLSNRSERREEAFELRFTFPVISVCYQESPFALLGF